MAKEPETQDHFTITVRHVPLAHVGDVLGDLAKRGHRDVSYELVTDVVTFRQRHSKGTAIDILREWLADHPSFETKEVRQLFNELGRTDAAAYSALKKLTEEGILNKIDDGHYSRADVMRIEGPDEKPKRTLNKVSHPDFVLAYARQHGGTVSRIKVMAHFEKHGRNPMSGASAITQLVNSDRLKRIGKGQFQITAKAAKKTNQSTSKPNGNGDHLTETITNG
jgi:hypothetical protein